LLEPLLPPERGRKSRPAFDNRQIVNGILWRIRTGAPWRDLPEKYGKWMTVYQRFRRWSEAGIWEALSPRPLPRRWPTTPATAWIRRRFAVMSRLPAQKGDSRTSFWPFAGRVHL
jgi:transposase